IYVFTGGAPGVEVGDLVDVSGQVVEFFGFTEFTAGPSVSVDDTDQDLPAAVPFGALIPSPDPSAPSCAIEFECYEGMLVSIADGTVTGGNQDFGSDPLAEIYITAAGSRTFREPGIEFPGLGGSIPTWDGNPEVFELDPDKLGLSNQVIPGGSSFAASGILGFEFGDYELWPTDLSFTPAALPLAVRARLPGEFTVGSLNLLRLFDSDSDYANRLSKFSAYINDVLGAPDVLGIQEAGSITELQDLAAQIVADYPAVSYTAHLQEGNDVGGIDVGFLVRNNVSVDTVTQLGAAELFTYDEPDSLLHDRPPLLLRGHYVGNGAPFPIAVMVVHIRSLNGIETERVQQKRLAQAQSIATMAQDFQSGDPLTPLIVIGDFNAFEFTDGYVDVLGQIRGDVNPAENVLSGPDLVSPDLANQLDFSASGERYSFVFEGNAQVLDHALTSSAAGTFARDLQFGRGNADAAHDQINDPGVLRSSDHDGLVLYLMSDFDGDGVADDLDECPIDPSKTVSRTGGDCTTAIPTLGPSGLLILLVVTGGWGAAVIRRR
ncbi:MAG: hypothetical protein GWM87_14355, partial [Xanthomonadales bacterium]|nr:hypothetical protein [Xanthomonadales bacterium]NIX13987.1 hypothetical protein [Xanthomonadales bacterium]